MLHKKALYQLSYKRSRCTARLGSWDESSDTVDSQAPEFSAEPAQNNRIQHSQRATAAHVMPRCHCSKLPSDIYPNGSLTEYIQSTIYISTFLVWRLALDATQQNRFGTVICSNFLLPRLKPFPNRFAFSSFVRPCHRPYTISHSRAEPTPRHVCQLSTETHSRGKWRFEPIPIRAGAERREDAARSIPASTADPRGRAVTKTVSPGDGS